MCGIGVNASKSSILDTASMKPFMDCIKHRGPDSQNIIQINDHFLIANNRLATIDNKERSNQPFTFKHLTITFNGAIYNYIELREDLINLGHKFSTECDTEVILHAYEEYGPECVHKFNGMWAFAIHNAETNTLFACRDRFSIKPLYYYHDKSSFYIASEIKQFKAINQINLSFNKKRIVQYLNNGGFKNFDYKTFYNEIFQLEGGTYMIFNLNTFTKELYKYYEFNDSSRNEIFLNKDLKSLIENSIDLRLRSDDDPGVTLSGGIDSSIITIQTLKRKPQTSSYSFLELRDESMNEEEFIKSLILKFPHKNNQVLLPENLEQLIDECIYFQDEPPASLSVVAQYILYKLANYNKEKVILSGQGADEIFGGYPRFFAFIPKVTLLYYFRNAWKLFISLIKKKRPIGESIFNYDSEKKNSFRTSSDYSKYLISKYGLRDLLHYEDRNSMANSIESRLPYMDFRLVEAMINSKNSFKFQLAKLKGALYNSFKTDLPKKIFNRINKIAFDTPEKELLKENFFNPNEELEKLKSSFPDLPWNSKFKTESINDFTAWQIYFLNKFIDSHP